MRGWILRSRALRGYLDGEGILRAAMRIKSRMQHFLSLS